MSSNRDARERSHEKIRKLLRGNNFPEKENLEAEQRSLESVGEKKEKKNHKATLRLPFCSDELDKKIRSLVRHSRLPFRVSYQHATSIKRHVVRSALEQEQRTCGVHKMFVEQQSEDKKGRGKPRVDCISCKAGLDSRFCDREGAVYLLKCKICSEEYIGESQRAIRIKIGEPNNQACNRYTETAWREHMKLHPTVEVGKDTIFTASLVTKKKSPQSARCERR